MTVKKILLGKWSRKAVASPVWAALEWLRSNEHPGGGIRVHDTHSAAYPEVTGYLLPTLLLYGQKDLALHFTDWLLCIQLVDGAFPDFNGRPVVFDTGQVLRGLLEIMPHVPSARPAAERAAGYLYSRMIRNGLEGYGRQFNKDVPEFTNLYTLPPLAAAGKIFNKPEYGEAARNAVEYFRKQEDFLNPDVLTHFLAYGLEALIDLGRADLAGPVLEKLEKKQAADGSVAGKGGAGWVCVPGLAQLAVCWYKFGRWQPAEKALEWLEKKQSETGGFCGSYGKGASYFPDREIPWAVKYYLDAHRLRVQSFMERNFSVFPAEVDAQDGRFQEILKKVRDGDRVLEAGCGKGRFLKALLAVRQGLNLTGLDICRKLLDALPPEIYSAEGCLEAIPLPDNNFDVVFSVEAVEHAASFKAAVNEMMRVAKPGGWVVIIDKHAGHWGRLSCPSWERWPEKEVISGLLKRECCEVKVVPVAYGRNKADGLMLAWMGRKRPRLSGDQWNSVLISSKSEKKVIAKIQSNQISDWARVVFRETEPGHKVLEIGSGTGEISIQLARSGRRVTALDCSRESLDFALRCAKTLEISLETIQADATKKLPIEDGHFDCVWNAGLLEHFFTEERRAMLREWTRVTRHKMVSIVPNASSLAYQIGKLGQENNGSWAYGLEMPLVSQREDFEAAGLKVTSECSISPRQALNFLPAGHPLREFLARYFKNENIRDLQSWNQGYLLVTVGIRK